MRTQYSGGARRWGWVRPAAEAGTGPVCNGCSMTQQEDGQMTDEQREALEWLEKQGRLDYPGYKHCRVIKEMLAEPLAPRTKEVEIWRVEGAIQRPDGTWRPL